MITRAPLDVPRTLGAWADALGARLDRADALTPVTGITDDSREAGPGLLFFARRGWTTDGVRYTAEARARGAVAVVREALADDGVPALRVQDAARALRDAADLQYGRPQDALDLVGVTGTKGKTTTAWLVAAALRHAGRRTAVLGTIAHDLGDGVSRPALNTTPGVLELRRLLAAARDGGARCAVLEVSSHALDQGRTDGLTFSAAVFTNLGHDHLDYHGDVETYFRAKSRLFRGLDEGATAVVNRDDPRGAQLIGLGRGRVLTYGTGPDADLRVADVRLTAERTLFHLLVGGELEVDVDTALIGRHNALNAAAAVGAALALDVDAVTAVRGIEQVQGVPGRLQRVVPAGDLHVFVDYAHTEEALRQVLSFLREVGASPLVCVVGCGGDRDRTKRPRMAAAAAELADRAIFTSDNPRNEDPLAILADMEAGVSPALAGRVTTVPDRREAIRRAVEEAPPGACLLVAGKGHETYQILGSRRVPFDDVEEVRHALALRRCAPDETRARAEARSPNEV